MEDMSLYMPMSMSVDDTFLFTGAHMIHANRRGHRPAPSWPFCYVRRVECLAGQLVQLRLRGSSQQEIEHDCEHHCTQAVVRDAWSGWLFSVGSAQPRLLVGLDHE
ncbi:hypothetical protein C8Q70DRAFT_169676 [Cubamyces menziesii]|nr:hypothetical protein C8Q70DRAFT_169676 [Cubamyces menziesii]